MEANKYTNHLINTTSPYLLQHAHNPVNWYPWQDDAFEIAKKENKPVFLSIGYSTCHWCHVMAQESFEDEEVAKLLNDHFISIKVDREERPDIDSIYMNVAQALTGSGGWPLTIVMTPDKKPFFAGTYFPKENKYGRIGLVELLNQIALKWKEDEKALVDSGEEITKAIINYENASSSRKYSIDKAIIFKAMDQFESRFDSEFGGFGNAPKFPTPHHLMFLLHSHNLKISEKALPMAEKTLMSMYKGGLFDHVGGGFSRYSTDEKWLVPHFEKMLYDNALLTMVYSEAYQLTKKEIYKYIVQSTLDYIKREMTSPKGGFYSAQDADSEGEEGKYYIWDYDEIVNILGSESEEFCKTYNIRPRGNFEGRNILNLIGSSGDLPDKKTQKQLSRLYRQRLERYPLHKDDKILVSWNSMMIGSYAKAGRIFENEDYIKSAEDGFNFIMSNMVKEDGTLFISYRDGKSSGTGLLDDYAYLMWACLELYESTYNIEYLKECMRLYNLIEENFSNKRGGYFLSSKESEDLIYRPREFYDGAVPSGNSVLAYVLSKLSKLTGNFDVENSLNLLLETYAPLVASQSSAYSFALKALLLNLYSTRELVAVGSNINLKFLISSLAKVYLPQLTSLAMVPENEKEIKKLAPHIHSYSIEDENTFYLCENFTCSSPLHYIDELMQKL
ncbi:thioredoxin domain-containing protein [Anaerosphaera multitolerans]|uniref:Thioredoxin domain-containing protein n=1 Tax=Anaerosphaera multitolerans TaxID=2487351 RepID=A0A437S7I3_9FIRM|nr:thioredoxin domain-containing protein [Anaerosphaera multitolerans]RVU55016.1 thioredoxin domain-containing protein [Anaerosphaera multitolerans]